MNTRAINAADAVVRRYNSRNPEEIISRRAIKVKDIRYCRDLLGYYSVMLNCEYIGINPNCTTTQRVSALAHELGHAFFDRSHRIEIGLYSISRYNRRIDAGYLHFPPINGTFTLVMNITPRKMYKTKRPPMYISAVKIATYPEMFICVCRK